ncbi:hypothetical protein AVEN_62536-1 [Araneus ventricosus]|uniref:Uncharacterized protein n=1 Tax=Araneus ventricosus TaxID=182803 RepID=A0A4Y1ZL90_ARAVE|nr:hypothetical protein AVEN_62536-1 [Araneus ventricosus]
MTSSVGQSDLLAPTPKCDLTTICSVGLFPGGITGLVQPTLSPARLQLDCSENVDEEAVEQWINEDSTLECCEVLSDDDIVSRVTCGSEETRNLEECPESDEENLATRQKLSLGDALVHTEALHNYLE